MIRTVRREDVPAITDIYNEYIRHSNATFETEAVREEEMARRVATFSADFPYIVYDDGEVKGYAYAHHWQTRAAYAQTWETTVYVSRGHLHEGIGEALMLRLIAACRESGKCHALIACITHGNEGSCALHQKLGFKRVGYYEEVGLKFGQRLDVEDWELIL